MASNEWVTVRLRLQNARQFAAEAATAAGSISALGNATTVAGEKAKVTSAEMFALRQGLYTLRRYLFYGTTAVAGFALGMVKLGLTFDTARDEGTNAFTAILGSASLARGEISRLTDLTYETGIQLTTLTESATRMQGFGFTLRSINVDMRALGDYAERAHLGVSGFESLVGVFDQIESAGKLTSVSLRTLTHEGVPALQILRRELHLTAEQMTALQQGRLVIPARFALPALATGLQQRANVLGPSLQQEIGRGHALLASIFGQMEAGLFSWATGALGSLNRALTVAARGGSFLHALDPGGGLILAWNLLTAAVRGIVAPFHALWAVLRPIEQLLSPFGGTLGFVARQTWLVTGAVAALTTWWTISRTRLLALWAAERLVAASETAYLVGLYALDAATASWAAITAVATGEMTALDIAMDANPIGVVAIAIAGLGFAMYELATHLRTVVHWAHEAWDWLNRPLPHRGLAGLLDLTPVGPLVGPGIGAYHFARHHIPGLASGGTTLSGGTVKVGEHGPELLHLPAGATVQPLSGSGSGALVTALVAALAQLKIAAAPINLDSRPIAEATFRWQLTEQARA